MKKFLGLLLLLAVTGGSVCYFMPDVVPPGTPGKVEWDKLSVEMKKAAAALTAPEAARQVSAADLVAPATVAPVISPMAFPANMDARAQARAENRPALILWYGSDWQKNTDELAAEWNKLADRNLPVIIGQINEHSGAVPQLSEREKLLPTGAFMNLPVAVLLAPDDTLLAVYQGKAVLTAAAMEAAVQRTLNRMPEYMALVAKARSTAGVEGARAAGEALAMMPYADAMRNHALRKILNEKDPEHKTMYRYLYGMDHMGMYDEINAVLNGGKGADARFKGAQRKFAEALAFVQKVLAAHPMNTDLLQQWNSGLAYVYREQHVATKDAQARQKMLECYRRVVEIDPASEYGKGAARWVRYWDDSVYYEFEEPYYDREHQTFGFEKEWRVNVSSFMKGPGTYAFSLQPILDGRMVTRAFKLYANGKHVADATTPENVNTKSVEFKVPRTLKGKVEVRFRAQCNDHWYECSGKMVMEKK